MCIPNIELKKKKKYRRIYFYMYMCTAVYKLVTIKCLNNLKFNYRMFKICYYNRFVSTKNLVSRSLNVSPN